jgi:hypothetical protein
MTEWAIRAGLLATGLVGIVVATLVASDNADDAPAPAEIQVRAPSEAAPNTDAADAGKAEAGSSSADCDIVSPAAETTGGTYVARFTGTPGAPRGACRIEGWDVQVHSRDSNTWLELEPIDAQHGPDCAGPPAAHHAEAYEDSVYLCRDHLMTAIRASGYGVIYLTPNQMVDFSTTEGVIQFDLSTERMSTRDWWDVWVTPYEDNLALPFNSGDVDLQGVPKRGLHLDVTGIEYAPILYTMHDYAEQQQNSPQATAPIDQGIAAGTNQSAVRQTFKLTVNRTFVRFERLPSATAPALVFFEGNIEDLGFSKGVVQFGHHSYNPTKDNAGVPATWHWDNFSISPAVPFTIIGADRRYAGEEKVTFDRPAPANSMLRFSGIGAISVSIDGAPFQRAQLQPGSTQGSGHVEHMSSYWHPIPEGARSIRLRFAADSWYKGPFIAKDFAIWAPQ